MPFLDVALAFSLTMLIVATIVTQLVDLLKNTTTLRSKQLRAMLEKYFNDEIAPVIKCETERLSAVLDATVTNALNTAAASFDANQLLAAVDTDKLAAISTNELKEFIKRSALGSELLTNLGDEAEDVFNKLGKRYDAIGDRFSESFKKHSRIWSIGVTLVLALAVNIDSIQILDSYINDKGTRDVVVGQLEGVVASYEAKLKSQEGTADQETVDTIKQDVAEVKEDVASLTTSGFPVGWNYFPYKCFFKADSESDSKPDSKLTVRNCFMWVLGILLTVALAGLGAPFWYDLISGITQVAKQAKTPKEPTNSSTTT